MIYNNITFEDYSIIILFFMDFYFCSKLIDLVGVSHTTHTTHDTEDIVVGSINTDFGGVGGFNGGVGKNKLKSGVVDSGHVAGTGRLMFFRAKSEGIDIDTSGRSASVVLIRLDKVKVSTFTLSKTILAVKL